jgi:2-dehydro-3-deoxyphosphogalactonate aldolase
MPICPLRLAVTVMPGVATATEVFTGIHAGATALKLFPASCLGPAYLKGLRAVLPSTVRVYPVGGIGAADVAAWLAAGAAGFGFGSELFKPEFSLDEIGSRTRSLQAALRQAPQQRAGTPGARAD